MTFLTFTNHFLTLSCLNFFTSAWLSTAIRLLLLSDKDEDFDRGVLLKGLQLDGDLEEGLTLKTKLSDVMSKVKSNPLGSIILQINCF